ncbi:MAG: hypothetical protein AAGA77_09940 [Bacteroidota bacterium]
MKTLLLSLLFIFGICCGLMSQTTYDNYEECSAKKPSFETLGYVHCQDAEEIEPIVSDSLQENLKDTALMMFLELLDELEDQQDYLDNIGLTCEDMRIPCFQGLSIPSGMSQLVFDAHVAEMENLFSIDEKTYTKTNNYISEFETRAPFDFAYRLHWLKEYLDIAYEIKYTKAEILRDFTGHCDVFEYLLHNVPSKFCSTLDVNGLSANESLRRIKDIRDCKEEANDPKFLVGSSRNYLDFFYSCNGTVYLEVGDSYINQELYLDVFTLEGNLVREFRNIMPLQNNEMFELPDITFNNSILLFTIRNSSRIILTKKIYCSK